MNIQSLARSHTPSCISALAGIVRKGRTDTARVNAAIALLDRGWGKAPQSVTVDGQASIKVVIRHILEGKDGEAMDANPNDIKMIEGDGVQRIKTDDER
jgi:hypothetical protein